MASLQMAAKPTMQEPQGLNSLGCIRTSTINRVRTAEQDKRRTPAEKSAMAEQETELNRDVQNATPLKPLEEDHIEQMIEELLDYGSIELCPAVPTQAM